MDLFKPLGRRHVQKQFITRFLWGKEGYGVIWVYKSKTKSGSMEAKT